MRGGAAGMMGSSTALLGVAAQIMVLASIACLIMLLVGVGVLVFLHVCTVGRAFSAVARSGNMGVDDEARKDMVGLSSDDLDDLPCVDFAGDKGGAADCAVCLETFQPGERCRVLPRCRHWFHVLCADSWLSRAPVCPICRAKVGRRRGGGGGGGDGRADAEDVGWFDRRLAMDMRESRQVLIR